MKKIWLLTTLIVLLIGFVVLPIAAGHEGIGKGHYAYKGKGLGHIKHGDYGHACMCSPDPSRCMCAPPCPPCTRPLAASDTLDETEDDILWLLEDLYYLELWWELFPEDFQP